jgi:hypothetical protein
MTVGPKKSALPPARLGLLVILLGLGVYGVFALLR